MPCQDSLGSNMQPMGGFGGGCTHFGGATEYQGHGTPHFHGEAHFVNIYQFHTLVEIGERIKAGLLEPQALHDFHSWFHRQEPFDVQQYEDDCETVEAAL